MAEPHKPQQIFKVLDQKAEVQDAASKVVDGFDNFASRLGLNNDNTLSAGLYVFNLLTRNRIQLEAAYRGSWIVGQVIDTVAEDMTKAGIEITSAKEDENIGRIQAEITRRGIWTSLCDEIKWGRLYGGAIAVLQIAGQDLKTPLDIETVDKGQFKGIIVYDRWQVQPDLTHIINEGPEIGLPMYYDIITTSVTGEPTSEALAPELQGQATQVNAGGFVRVHHSRIIRNIGIQLPFWQAITEQMWGESVLERLWDRLIAFDSSTMSAANLIERANNRMVGIEGLREIIAAGGNAQKGLEAQFEMMRLMQTNEGITLLDKNDVFQTTQYTFSGLSDVMLQFGQQLAGASGIPLVRLFGQSPAGLNSTGESDIRMYYDNINAQQESRLRPAWDLLLKVLWRSTFGTDAPDDLEFSFVPLWQMSAKDKSDIAKSNAETIAGAQEAGLISRSAAMKELRDQAKETGLFVNISDQDIADAEKDDEDPPLPGESVPGAEEPGTELVPEGNDDQKVVALAARGLDSKHRGILATIRRWVGR